nr:MAG TPA: hypothetical protein [Caudoviricetes sp.]
MDKLNLRESLSFNFYIYYTAGFLKSAQNREKSLI